MRYKLDVNLELQPTMAMALPAIDLAYDDIGAECTITSAKDGLHRKGSKHNTGEAVDARTRHLTDMQVDQLILRLRFRLNGSQLLDRPYNVVYEVPKTNPQATAKHMHIEYDPV